MKILLLIVGFVLLIGIEMLRVYFIMPFPGSQESNTIEIAYFIHKNIIWFRLLGWGMLAYPFAYYFRQGTQIVKVVLAVLFGFYVVLFYMFNFKLLADKMFLQPTTKKFLSSADNKVLAKQLIIGVTIGNESKAYPIEIIGYHHQVRDTIGGKPAMITYCTVCRTGTVFNPMVDGKPETFRLVGMDHYNAMFEDATTHSWWRQVNGEAITGSAKGKMLEEIPSQQMTLAEWLNEHPDSKVMQPDALFVDAYKELEDYDEGKRKGRLERRDSLPWLEKSWIVGIQIGMASKAYDWINLQNVRVIDDNIAGIPVLVTANPDSASYHTFNRIVGTDTLSFVPNKDASGFSDLKTTSQWNWNGKCVAGALLGNTLTPIQSYQEYWHSWKTFRPQTTRYTLR